MKTALLSACCLWLAASVYAGEKWNDALSSSQHSTTAESLDIVKSPVSNVRVAPVELSSSTDVASAVSSATVTTASVSAPVSTGREILIAHLQKIKSQNVMINTITLEPYWQSVFSDAGHPELYASSSADIQTALEAGLAPYLRGQPLSARDFADAALRALRAPDENPQ
jgi:hypothetical protein